MKGRAPFDGLMSTTMSLTLFTGLFASAILIAGAAWPEPRPPKNPRHSIKNWLFAVGGIGLLIYAILNAMAGGPIFYVFLELLVLVASGLMMIDASDRTDTIVLGLGGLGFVIASLLLAQGGDTLVFIAGLVSTALGYALQAGTARRDFALTLGSGLIAIFSYLGSSWIFFGMNFFFMLFSGYYLIKKLRS